MTVGSTHHRLKIDRTAICTTTLTNEGTMNNNQSIEDRLNQLGRLDGVADAVEEEEFSPMSDPAVTQHIIRSNADGIDQFNGQFRVSLRSQQATTVLHVPLHPPMESAPVAEAYCENEAVRIRVTEVQRFGVRLEIKTNVPAAGIDEVIQVQITQSAVDNAS